MFLLVKFHNEKLSIVKARYVKQHTKYACVAAGDEEKGENIEDNIDDLEDTEGNCKTGGTLFEDSKNSSSSSNRKRRSSEY